jgi:hypothetical protein
MVEPTIAVTARYPSDATTKELVKLLGLSEAAMGENICKAFVSTVSGLDNESIFLSAPSMVGSNAGSVLLSKSRLSIAFYIGEHSEASQSGATDGTVTKALNCFVSLLFNHWQLKVFRLK